MVVQMQFTRCQNFCNRLHSSTQTLNIIVSSSIESCNMFSFELINAISCFFVRIISISFWVSRLEWQFSANARVDTNCLMQFAFQQPSFWLTWSFYCLLVLLVIDCAWLRLSSVDTRQQFTRRAKVWYCSSMNELDTTVTGIENMAKTIAVDEWQQANLNDLTQFTTSLEKQSIR